MAKKNRHKKKHGIGWFLFGMAVYAVVILGAAFFGLKELWAFLESYEASRDYHTIDAYMENLTPEHICDTQADLIAQVDHNVQSEEECRQALLSALTEDITYARKAAECTDTKQVYILRCGKQVIGSFSIAARQPDEYGFTPWEFASESFDLSYMIGSTVSAVSPMDYPVYVNGVQLDDSYVVDTSSEQIKFLTDYYEEYDLPVFYTKTYEAGPFLGDLTIEVTDPEGDPYVYDETMFDKDALADNCTDQEKDELDTFVREFLKRYILFAGCANDRAESNYNWVIQLVVPGSTLASRMLNALDGMQFAQSMGDELDTVTTNHRVKLSDGVYLYDVTYLVNTVGREGVVQTTNNAHVIVVEQNGSLLVDRLIAY